MTSMQHLLLLMMIFTIITGITALKLVETNAHLETLIATPRATIECIRNCQFSLPIDHEFQLPSSCDELISSIGCETILVVNYTAKTVSISFLTKGDEMLQYRTEYLVQQTVAMQFQQRQITREINTFCFTLGCDVQYAKQAFDSLGNRDHLPVLNDLTPLLFNPVGTSLSRCYNMDNQSMDCTNKLCEATVPSKINITGSKDCEQFYDLSYVSIEINEYRAYPSVTGVDDNDYRITCNIELCNGGETTTNVQNVINKYKEQLSIVPPALRIECIQKCTFSLQINEQFQLPSSCTQRISSFGCFTIIVIDYTTKSISVSFLTDGSEIQESGQQYVISQTVEMEFQQKIVKREVNTFCFTADCDENYAIRTINRLSELDHSPLLNELSSYLYDSTGTSVSQCYDTSNQPMNCTGKLCEASIPSKPGDPGYKDCEQIYDLAFVSIEINEYRAYPTTGTEDDDNDYEIVCNRELCNGGGTTTNVQNVINKYKEQLAIVHPTNELASTSSPITISTTPMTTAQSTTMIALALLLNTFCYIHKH
ncbi:unnamed protein product [Didymodactylos carnosus]|uniref:Uncharacterized protein n=1 Tax=Didymodactylos carnosus TaxID=1234261 RepID=A0A814XXC2_9BILA|nr:unnamed protein product [Didymodactylos carnosus]CAF1221600.1 unnamed protein product [Didymodactylos carnosus]CAF3764620.1 unnamed protein product [Didymodactylos carnosus]CAF3984882.1 unnamed protein product [Didymodactylos carnosus]